MRTRRKNYHLIKIVAALFFWPLLLAPQLASAQYPDGYYDVARIIDGDTFELSDGKAVRLIGINTPEMGERCSSEAKDYLSSLIHNESVYLEKDVSETDIYNRLLRYVYIDGIFVNYKLVDDGYAEAVAYPPDIQYSSDFSNAEAAARAANRGCLWGESCRTGCYVQITKTGSKYHSADCRYLSQSDIEICRDEAIKQGSTACKVCEGQCDVSGGDGGGGG